MAKNVFVDMTFLGLHAGKSINQKMEIAYGLLYKL